MRFGLFLFNAEVPDRAPPEREDDPGQTTPAGREWWPPADTALGTGSARCAAPEPSGQPGRTGRQTGAAGMPPPGHRGWRRGGAGNLRIAARRLGDRRRYSL